jgi:hypothetical protein
MKAISQDVERLREIANEVRTKSRNPRHALVEMNALAAAADIAFKASMHMRFQKKMPRVDYFDKNIVEETPEKKLTAAAKTLARQRNKTKP